MKKNTFKIIFDIFMTFLLLLMYKKNVFGMAFHEIGGIIVCLLFIVHKLLNKNWIVEVTKNLFTKSIPGKVKFMYLVDLLLLVDVTAILITGIGINKTISSSLAFLSFSGKIYHFFFGGLSIILVALHIGLHWNWIKGTILGKAKNNVPKFVTVICLVIFIAAMGGGIYAVSKSSLGRWLSAPFTSQTMPQQGQMKGQMPEGQMPDFDKNQMEKMKQFKNQGGGGQSISFINAILCIVQFAAIYILIAGITAIISGFITKQKLKHLKKAIPPSAEQ